MDRSRDDVKAETLSIEQLRPHHDAIEDTSVGPWVLRTRRLCGMIG